MGRLGLVQTLGRNPRVLPEPTRLEPSVPDAPLKPKVGAPSPRTDRNVLSVPCCLHCRAARYMSGANAGFVGDYWLGGSMSVR